MEYGQLTETRYFAIGVVASLMLHVFAALAFMDEVDPHSAPAVPEAVEVELVPPPPPLAIPEPEELEPEEPEPEEPEPEEPEPEEQPEVEEPAEPEPPAQLELPSEPEPAPAEELTELPEEQLPEEVQVLQPVKEFGEEDSAPEDSEEGAPEQAPEEPTDAEADETTDEQEPAEEELDGADEALNKEDEPTEDTSEATENEPATEDTGEAETVDSEAEDVPQPETDAVVVEKEILPTDFGTVGEIVTLATPTAKPNPSRSNGSGGGRSAPSSTLPKSQRLFSGHFTADPRVRSAMNGMPPGERMNLLCITELREQLQNEVPPFIPDRLPNFRPQKGTVLEPGRAAFRSFGIWYDIAFRCEVDSGVRRVENFAYKVGKPIPRSKWAERRLPAN
ncbi:MAG: DUF930 domain-containing protein [Roseibium sp.]